MLSRRIIPCLDVRDGRTTKGIKFRENIDIGDPVEMAKFYYEEGADEIVFYDITASSDKRDIMIDVVNHVAEEIFIPFSVGGGIRTLDDMRRVLLAVSGKDQRQQRGCNESGDHSGRCGSLWQSVHRSRHGCKTRTSLCEDSIGL